MRLTGFRGVADRECRFAERGVTVVSGRNEAGKSSMVEALDLLLDVPSSSKSAKVRAVQPAGHDVATEIEAEISCGPWHFTYTKVFNKGQSTTLSVHSPQPEQLTGKAAHERVRAILEQSVDLALFRASRVVQDGASASISVSKSVSLTNALDRAVSDPDRDEDAGEDSELLVAVEAEYTRYFTAGRGQETGELLAARQREARARRALDELDEAMAAIDGDVARVAELTARRKQLGSLIEQVKVEVEQTESARRAAYELRDRLAGADSVAEAALLRHRACTAERDARRRAAAKIGELAEAKSTATQERDQAREAMAKAVADGTALEQTRAEAEAILARAREALDEAEAVEVAARHRKALATAVERLEQAVAAYRELAAREAELAANTVDAAVLARARQLREDLLETTAQLRAVATTMRIRRLGDRPILVDNEESSGDEVSVVAETVVEVPGVVRVELSSGADAVSLASRRDEIEAVTTALCSAHGAADLDALIASGESRMMIEPRVTAARVEADRIGGGKTLDELRADVARLRAEVGEEGPAQTAPDLAVLREAERVCATEHLAAERAVAVHARSLADLRATAERASEKAERLTSDIDEMTDALAAARQEQPDAALEGDIVRTQEELTVATSAAERLRAEMESADLADLEQRVAVLDDRLEHLEQELADGDREIAQATARIDLCRDDARHDRREEAASAHTAAQAELTRVAARAEAARLLRSTLNEHRAAAHLRYSEPFRQRLEELARPLFGPGVRFTVDEQLGITARTLDGTTVPFDDLSVGAREQIGIIARLACAVLVDEADGVPVIIDDALGHSDSDRVAQMAQVLTSAGENAQVIVLTCAPERYSDVDAASAVEL
ncbi:hypothetical protein GOARA_076_00190 [Gordonia araii NBRC 100433]|uniref:Rad50/SbcC-type AAA domain-containing protein n=1 Tax=Gordonia araii NBRC 100433 TaxID=1073574 RepID=G7H6N4_9ACTN|nr:AAA family ATPase [Gordonia araii]GAB11509.1 hypothetical protein GOARA_076_00190 [Gordonia araii NBRC 100433]